MRYQVCLIHPFDPRGKKVGGLETYIRDFITFHPEDFDLVIVGVDGSGDLQLGKIINLEFRGRRYRFLPVLRYPEDEMREAAIELTASITLQFFWALIRHYFVLRRLFNRGQWTVELRRMEFAIFPWLWRVPFIQMLHGEGSPKQRMDSLLRKYWFVQQISERFAVSRSEKFLCVNPNITTRVRKEYPKFATKVDTLTTWANTQYFSSQPFREGDGVFRIVFCGRLDHFKVPPLMFRAIAKLRARSTEGVEFHYVGVSDPTRFPEFEEIRDITVLHGFQDASGIARIHSIVDAGILTSEFEGMPRFVLETLRSGRPVVAIHLPQLEPVIEDGVSGYLVERLENGTDQVEAVVDRLSMLRSDIFLQKLDPVAISAKTEEFSPQRLLGRVYEYHREIHSKHRLDLPRLIDKPSICLVHPMDPRGDKVGGIETHIRQMIQYAPGNWHLLFIGVDSVGDCKLGEITQLEMHGRSFDFLPVCTFAEDRINNAAKRLTHSITLRFGLGLVKYFAKVRKAIRATEGSIELQRYEFAVLPRLVGRPGLQIIHGEGSRADKMDSLIKRYWLIHRLNEEVAIRFAKAIVCVNPNIARRVVEKLGSSQQVVCMPVSVDTSVFRPTPFRLTDGIFRVMFAGRLDEFKDPPTMFRTLAKVHNRLNGAFEFHYVGTSDPKRYVEAKLIGGFIKSHGYLNSFQVAQIAGQCHAGILTSFFEGMPCYLLEMLAAGRPVVGIRLPQYDSVIDSSAYDLMIDRVSDQEALSSSLAAKLCDLWSAICDGRVDPAVVARKATLFSVEAQLSDHFNRHDALMAGKQIVETNVFARGA